MSKENTRKPFDFKRDALYPACAIFCVILFLFYLYAWSEGENVIENTTHHTEVFDNITGSTTTESEAPQPTALPVQMLVGIFLFALTLMLAGEIFRLEYSPLVLRLSHLFTVLVSFFIFVLALPGYVSGAGAPAAMVATLAVAALYFVFLGLKLALSKLLSRIPVGVRGAVRGFILPAVAVFTLIVFAVSFFNLISQVHVIVHENVEKVFLDDDIYQTSYRRVATPLAPTIQNYLRYLLSAAVYMIGYKLLFLPLGRVTRVVFNFLVLTAGYLGIWVFGMDYFRMVPENALPAVVVYLSAYLVTLIAVSAVIIVKSRQRDETEDYESQFSTKGRKR